jgi:hypothetical protein
MGRAITFSALQFLLALTWTVYVIFLPKLAAEVGLAKDIVPWLLLLDQAIFAVMDWRLGMAADRIARSMGRLGKWMALVTAVSCAAFLLLPFAAMTGSPWLLIALTIVWSATSSALRAPPLVLLGRYTEAPEQPWAAGLFLFGLGVAGAIAPFLIAALRDIDARLPFAICSLTLIATTLAIASGEQRQPAKAPVEKTPAPASGVPVAFLAAIVLLGLGFQLHFAVNSAPNYLRFAKPAELERLMPVFWIGFNLLILPASLLTKRHGGPFMMAAGALIGAVAAVAVAQAGTLRFLVAAQFVAGAAWGCVMMSALAAALAMGRTGREGFVTGALWSLLAVATFTRIAIVIAQLPQQPDFKPLLAWAPAVLWLAAGALVARSARAPARHSA